MRTCKWVLFATFLVISVQWATRSIVFSGVVLQENIFRKTPFQTKRVSAISREMRGS
jgi:hypothetical protein